MTDTERKILTILWSLCGGVEARANVKQLQRLSQRSYGQVKAAMQHLIKEGYIQQNGDMVKVLRVPMLKYEAPVRKWWEEE